MVFIVDDTEWTLDLREGTQGALYAGAPKGGEKPDLTLTITDTNFVQLVMGKLNPQQVCAIPGSPRPPPPPGVWVGGCVCVGVWVWGCGCGCVGVCVCVCVCVWGGVGGRVGGDGA